MARAVSLVLLVVLGLAVTQARQLQQAKFKTVADALSAPENSQLSTLLAAVKVRGWHIRDRGWRPTCRTDCHSRCNSAFHWHL